MPALSKVEVHSPGGRIRLLRQARGWSQLVLASKVGVSQAMVSFWETNAAQPSPPTLRLLADVLQASPDFLYPDRFTREGV